MVGGEKHINGAYEAWIAADVFRGGVKVFINGAQGFERTLTFPIDEDWTAIAERVRETLED